MHLSLAPSSAPTLEELLFLTRERGGQGILRVIELRVRTGGFLSLPLHFTFASTLSP